MMTELETLRKIIRDQHAVLRHVRQKLVEREDDTATWWRWRHRDLQNMIQTQEDETVRLLRGQ